jgi:HSP20 family molecular chaperone IbpA
MCDDKAHGPRYSAGCCNFSPQDIAKMKRMAGHFMKNFMGHFGNYIPHNIEDLGDAYLITVPLPGRTKEEVKVSIINKIINVTASKPNIPEFEGKRKEDKGKSYPFPGMGFRFIDVNMDIPLPADAEENQISSKMANGLLRIIVNKKPAKNIDIKEEQNN